MNYLLPAQTLLDLCAAVSNGAQQWARTIDSVALRVSVISAALARATVANHPEQRVRTLLMANLDDLLAKLEADAGPLLAFDAGHARVWSGLLCVPELKGLVVQVDRQVYATAMHEGMTVVERANPAHEALKQLGLNLHVLSEGSTDEP